jgi:hypothetical protein|tara:strand:+ start:476 stop:595 length:120 start_codon:yes stop_codon:yes gene_type:complete
MARRKYLEKRFVKSFESTILRSSPKRKREKRRNHRRRKR